jgi:hypothetical protein
MHFLPRRFSKLGNYTDQQRHLAGAFRVFFNAELENYFEVIARNVAAHAESEWLAGRTTRAFAALCSRNSKNINMPQETKSIDTTGAFLHRRFEKELEIQRKAINDNNGAKSRNILQMFVPLGIDESAIDTVLLAECDTLGSGRGLLAHQTGGPAVYLIDPRTEYDQAIKIVSLLNDFEALLEF